LNKLPKVGLLLAHGLWEENLWLALVPEVFVRRQICRVSWNRGHIAQSPVKKAVPASLINEET
jgi:hypothetical protein